MKLWLFWILWGIDALIGAIAVVFFLVGLTNGTVASFNLGIWIAILAALAVIIGGSLGLKAAGHPGFGMILCLVLAVPGLCTGYSCSCSLCQIPVGTRLSLLPRAHYSYGG
jgi:hypothetical protein